MSLTWNVKVTFRGGFD